MEGHHADGDNIIQAVLDSDSWYHDEKARLQYIKERDQRLWLELDSDHLLIYIIEDLVKIFPKSKFILPIRDPLNWLNSAVNQYLRLLNWEHPSSKRWLAIWRNFLKDTERIYPANETFLEDNDIPPLATFLSYWNDHNTDVLKMVNDENLLVIRTHEIKDHINEMAEFLNVDSRTLNDGRTHEFINKRKKISLSEQLDQTYLKTLLDKHCKELTNRYFSDHYN